MALQEKYAELINTATAAGVANLQVREQDNVLYIDGAAPTAAVKDQLWDIYEKIDRDFRTGDAVINITAPEAATTDYVVKPGDSLSKIGRKTGKNWQDIYAANKELIGSNPDHIEIGWTLKIPS